MTLDEILVKAQEELDSGKFKTVKGLFCIKVKGVENYTIDMNERKCFKGVPTTNPDCVATITKEATEILMKDPYKIMSLISSGQIHISNVPLFKSLLPLLSK